MLRAHLQSGQHDLLHRGEVGLPQELSLLPEGQDLVLVDGAHRGGDLSTTVTGLELGDSNEGNPVQFSRRSQSILSVRSLKESQ